MYVPLQEWLFRNMRDVMPEVGNFEAKYNVVIEDQSLILQYHDAQDLASFQYGNKEWADPRMFVKRPREISTPQGERLFSDFCTAGKHLNKS
jgi:hypothetical protein